MKLCFLLHNAYAIGGTVRATLNLANALAARHEVEIVSVFRTAERPLLELSRQVRLVPLVDERPDSPAHDGGHPLMGRPSAVVPPSEVLAHRYSALTDERLRDFLKETDADVVVATRPALVVFLARHGSRRYLRIGQEHLSYDNHLVGVRAAQNDAIPRLDAFVTVSGQDAADHRARLPGLRTRIANIPNAAPRPRAELSDVRAPLVVAAGRLMPVKRYDLLIEAFAKVVAAQPEWRLRIYGQGPERARLRAAVDTLRLNDHVFLMGPHPTMETEWAKASIAAVSSEWESFGMTILEAMHAGVPVVATDCPHGPGEIITSGSDGLLVTPGDPDALAVGLLKLIEDADQRRVMGESARETVQRFAPRRVAGEYERLIDELREARIPAAVKLTRRVRRAAGTLLPRRTRLRRTQAPPSSGHEPLGQESLGKGSPAKGAPGKGAAAPTANVPATDDRPRALRPKGRCTADSAGGVRIAVNRSGVSGKSLALVLRHRHGDDEIRVPLERPVAARSPWTADLTHDRLSLAEGRWDVHIARAEDGARRRLKATLVEQRGLLSASPAADQAFAWWIPYTTKDGFLALRTFRRPAHAEATALRTHEGSLAVEGLLHGAELGPGAALLGVSRSGRAHDFETTATTTTGARAFRARVTSLPPGPAEADKALWDLFLRPAETSEPLRIGRLVGDIVTRKETDKHPSTTLTAAAPGAAGGQVQARFFFTVTNDLAISAS
ncbi:glycosyltransferase family 4 protein [Streptomyces sporangiiformans]|uniref:D-inositol 3-phosphate glycosyltransferase n=1 Tax=Streptomyces sporangiiformans TaxID=2315329 RepID=A0A505DCI3_9ACTN|nr:glycosyltransferase [Streptomyces sporangiiformans]TPQ20527.1 glycosyltransferase [Streptomyces sporangiiformans]